jgi:hypothetical protein
MLRKWSMRATDQLHIPTAAYFGKAWKGSVKSSLRAMENRVFETYGKEKGTRILASAFHAFTYFKD